MIKNRILIVGGAGFLGFNLIKKINKNKNFKIDTIVKKSVKKNKKIKNVNYINCDISNLKSLKKNLEKSEYSIVINLSGNIDHNNHIETKKVHFVGLKNLVNIFKKKHLKLFIQIGSCLEYGKKILLKVKAQFVIQFHRMENQNIWLHNIYENLIKLSYITTVSNLRSFSKR